MKRVFTAWWVVPIFISSVLSIPLLSWTLISPSAQGWTNRDLTIYWNFSACTVPEADLLARLDQAIAAWNATSGVDLRLTRAGSQTAASATDFLAGTVTEVPIVLCDASFGTNNSVDANFVPAATRLSMPNGPIEYGGVLLNAEVGTAAELSNLSLDSLTVVLAHELGHVLGLGHSSVQEALMYYSITDKTAPIITEDDMDGLAFLYPKSEFSGGMFGCANAAVPAAVETKVEATRGLLMGLLLLSVLVFSIRIGRQMRHPGQT